MDGSIPYPELSLFVFFALIVAAIWVDRRVGFVLGAVAVILLWVMIVFVPITRWNEWVLWLQLHWWAALITVALFIGAAARK
jgi:hypothetical protein